MRDARTHQRDLHEIYNLYLGMSGLASCALAASCQTFTQQWNRPMLSISKTKQITAARKAALTSSVDDVLAAIKISSVGGSPEISRQLP